MDIFSELTSGILQICLLFQILIFPLHEMHSHDHKQFHRHYFFETSQCHKQIVRKKFPVQIVKIVSSLSLYDELVISLILPDVNDSKKNRDAKRLSPMNFPINFRYFRGKSLFLINNPTKKCFLVGLFSIFLSLHYHIHYQSFHVNFPRNISFHQTIIHNRKCLRSYVVYEKREDLLHLFSLESDPHPVGDFVLCFFSEILDDSNEVASIPFKFEFLCNYSIHRDHHSGSTHDIE